MVGTSWPATIGHEARTSKLEASGESTWSLNHFPTWNHTRQFGIAWPIETTLPFGMNRSLWAARPHLKSV